MKYRILIVEDTAKHIEDAKRVFSLIKEELSKKSAQIEIESVYVTNLVDAMEKLDSVDAVISDVFFPEKEGGEEESCGIKIVKKALSLHKATILITSTWHHGNKTQPVFEEYVRYGMEMFDSNPKDLRNGEADRKPWIVALASLIGLILAIEWKTVKFAEADKKNSSGYVYQLKDALVVAVKCNDNLNGVLLKTFFDEIKEKNWNEWFKCVDPHCEE